VHSALGDMRDLLTCIHVHTYTQEGRAGRLIPTHWKAAVHYAFGDIQDSLFDAGEEVVIQRGDGSLRFARVEALSEVFCPSVAACCSVLQRFAACGSVLQCCNTIIVQRVDSTLHFARGEALLSALSPFPPSFSRLLKPSLSLPVLILSLAETLVPALSCVLPSPWYAKSDLLVEMKSDLQKRPTSQKRPIEITKCVYKKYARRSAEASIALIAIMREST